MLMCLLVSGMCRRSVGQVLTMFEIGHITADLIGGWLRAVLIGQALDGHGRTNFRKKN